jgi:hypothetical protein
MYQNVTLRHQARVSVGETTGLGDRAWELERGFVRRLNR